MRYRSLLRRVPGLIIQSFRHLPVDLLPIRQVIQTYNRQKFRQDFRASVEVALLALPQGMAYALIAGLPIQCGLYACAIGALIGPLFASSRFGVLGPTNATSVLVLSSYLLLGSHVDKLGSLALLLTMTGLFLTIGSFCRMASLTQYISRSVVVGYITGAALLIIANQIHLALGFALPETRTFLEMLVQTVTGLGATQWPSLVLSLVTLMTWWILEKRFPKIPSVALTLILASLVAHFLATKDWKVACLQPLPAGSWSIHLPEIRPAWISQLASTALALAIFATIEGTSITKTLAHRAGDRLDGNQEIFSYGLANLGCALFGGMPCSGSLTRSTLNWNSGAVTQLAAFWSGVLCTLGILIFGPLIGYIPIPALAVLVVCVGVSLINPHQIRIAMASTRSDGIVFLTTFVASLLTPLDFAIYLGVGASIVLFLRKAGRPKLVEYTFDSAGSLMEKPEEAPDPLPFVSIIHVEGELFFGASELFREEIRRVCQDAGLKVVILRLKNAHHLDASSVMAIEELVKFLKETGRHLIISGAERDVYRVLRNSGVLNTIGRDNVFMASPHAPNVSTRRALLRAQQFLGSSDSRVKIFYDPQHQAAAPPQPAGMYEI